MRKKLDRFIYGKVGMNYSPEGKRNVLENRIMDVLFTILIPTVMVLFILNYACMVM